MNPRNRSTKSGFMRRIASKPPLLFSVSRLVRLADPYPKPELQIVFVGFG